MSISNPISNMTRPLSLRLAARTAAQQFSFYTRGKKRRTTTIACGLAYVAAASLLASMPSLLHAETCTMYQKYIKDGPAGTLCANQGIDFVEVSATGGAGTFVARKVPKCDTTGTDSGCVGDAVKSLDGTRAFYHVDGVPGSNNWVFFFEGGGSCGKMAGLNAAEACYDGNNATTGFSGYGTNIGDAFEMTSMHASGGFTVPSLKTGTGILSTSASNPFSGWNRVWVHKSSFDRFMGNITNTQPFGGDDIKLFFHGRRIIRAMLKDLDRSNGSIWLPGDDPFELQQLADLSSAEAILFVGESGGAGGLIQNAQWLTNRVAPLAPAAKVSFAPSSRMIAWLEAEAHYGSTGLGIWDDVYSGSSDVLENPATGGAVTTVTYSAGTFHPNGEIRDLLDSWGDIASSANLFLDDSCKTDHFDAAHNQWKCYDEGHVALYHSDEKMFFFESQLDGVHAGNGSPVFWMDTADFGAGAVALNPGFFWIPGATDPGFPNWYTQARANRVVYTIDSILNNTNHRGARGFYSPFVDQHTAVKNSTFFNNVMTKFGFMSYSYADALSQWEIDNRFVVSDEAWVEDTNAADPITWLACCGLGGGWVH